MKYLIATPETFATKETRKRNEARIFCIVWKVTKVIGRGENFARNFQREEELRFDEFDKNIRTEEGYKFPES